MSLDLSVNYLGLELQSPIVIGACPLTLEPEKVRQLALAGASAVVLPSLFEEQIVHQMILNDVEPTPEEERAEWIYYRQQEDKYNGGPAHYLHTIRQLTSSLEIPVIASLNGCTSGHWLDFARELEQAGAHAIELSIRPELSDPGISSGDVEDAILQCVQTVCDRVTIPVAVKLSPYFTHLANLAWRMAEAGADGLVLFGHSPCWYVNSERQEACVDWQLTPHGSISQTISGLLRIRAGNGPQIPLAASGGISTADDAIQIWIAGADVAMMTSEIYRTGPQAVSLVLNGLCSYMDKTKKASFRDFLASRPQTKINIRNQYLQILTDLGEYLDPTPREPTTVGDQWGHAPD